jgi:drug/metabolite transporter (DMT)-like permease
MTRMRRNALAALAAAGLLWGTTVPLSKVALGWLSPGSLTLVRFAVAAAILAVVTRSRLRAACTPAILLSGAIGYGGTVLLQNAGITRTSVSHAALLIGSVPVMVAIVAALWHGAVAKPVAWAGFGVSLAGVALLAGSGGSGAALSGDLLVLASLLVSAVFTVAQDRLLPGRDPVAVTAAQFLGAALASVPAALMSGLPAAPASAGPALALIGLTAGGTLLPFTLFAFGQSRVPAEVAGAFLNLEPLIGAAAGVALFGDPAGTGQLLGGGAILAGIALSSVPLLRPARVDRAAVTSAGAGTRAPAPVIRPGSGTATAGQSRPAAGALGPAAGSRVDQGAGIPRPAGKAEEEPPMAPRWATPATPPGGMRGPASRPGAPRQALTQVTVKGSSWGRCYGPGQRPATGYPAGSGNSAGAVR